MNRIAVEKWKQFILCILITLTVSTGCYFISGFIGYRSVALILLFTVSVFSMFFSVWPVLVAAVLSALIWDYFFIPPFYTFHINSAEDVLMLSMYFVIVLLNGILSSQIRHFEKQARLKEEKLNALNFYNTLFNSISHELRTPITTIMGVTENLLSKEVKLSEDNRNELNHEVLIAAARLNRLVDNLLNMSRIESGFLKPKLTWCDVNEIIHTAIGNLPENMQKNIHVNIQKDIPLVKLDFGLIEQTLNNLLHNARVHTPANTSAIVTACIDGNKLKMSVTDNGPGFPLSENLEKTDLYSQSGRKGGLGLGLTIARGFVNMHGGELLIENNAGGGACVSALIPAETMEWRESYE